MPSDDVKRFEWEKHKVTRTPDEDGVVEFEWPRIMRHIHRLDCRHDMQEAFNRKLMERLDKLEKAQGNGEFEATTPKQHPLVTLIEENTRLIKQGSESMSDFLERALLELD